MFLSLFLEVIFELVEAEIKPEPSSMNESLFTIP
jgi:hypothetical protein